jgi:cation diffusion facilitator CzcD-associated flavoprotein CzcO
VSNEYFDVVIVGAGLSGIGSARHLQDECPGKTYLILEGRESMGGTWDLFRFPGIRSDSDMYTLGYNFKPWKDGKAIADGPSILNYIKETAAEGDVDRHIRYGHLVKRVSWSTSDASWTIEAERKESGERVTIRCGFLLMCAGYYSYEQGYTRPRAVPGRGRSSPGLAGRPRLRKQEGRGHRLRSNCRYPGPGDGEGCRACGDGAALADLHGLATYMVSRPDTDIIANFLRKVLPEKIAYAITRWKNVRLQQTIYRKTRTHPDKVRKKLLDMVRKEMGPDYDVDTHFTPRYDPWDQRLCLVPNSDFFESVKSGKASIVTDHIESFTENGILLESGQELEADIIVTATGLNLVLLGGTELVVDGKPVRISDTFSYMGMMYSDVPNLVTTFGYINASWTLRADLTAEYACRIINHMDETACRQCTPRLRGGDRDMPARKWITDFSSGYMQRVMHLFPKQGDKAPWLNTQNFIEDKKLLSERAVDDGVLQFSNPAAESSKAEADFLESDAA